MSVERADAERIGPFDALGFRFDVLVHDAELLVEIERLLGGLRATSECTTEHEVVAVRDGLRLRLTIEGEQRFETGNEAVFYHQLIWEVTRRAVARSNAALVAHAGAVLFGDQVVMVAGRSGAGKSTTVAALLAAGGTYLTDEAVALDRDGHLVDTLARPMQLDARSHELLGIARGAATHIQPDGSSYLPVDRFEAILTPIPPHRVILMTLGSPGGPIDMGAAVSSDIAASMMRQAFEPGRRTQMGLDAATALATAATVIRCTGGTPRERADAVGEILERLRRNLVCGHPG